MKKIILFLIAYLAYGSTMAQEQQKSWLYKVMPDNVKVQHAGNIGFISAGIGYVSKNEKWKGDLMYGFVPAKYADDPINSITLKAKFAPINRAYENDIEVNWLHTGMFLNYSFGEQYFLGLPDYYDKGYYYFPTSLQLGLFAGSEIRYKKIGAYYEVGTTEKHLINYVKNTKSLNFNNLWNFSIGIVYHLK